MSFDNATIPLTFAPGSGYNDDGSYPTDFKTGRSWVTGVQRSLRVYKDGGVSLHSSGYRDPGLRRKLHLHGVEVINYGELRGSLTTPEGSRVPRSWLRYPARTVLVEDDRVYPLVYRDSDKESPMDALPPAMRLGSPLAVWQDKSMMPVCAARHTVYEQRQDFHDEWMDLHGEALRVARVLGALSGDGPLSARLDYLLSLVAKNTALSGPQQSCLYKAPDRDISNAVRHMTALTKTYDYLRAAP